MLLCMRPRIDATRKVPEARSLQYNRIDIYFIHTVEGNKIAAKHQTFPNWKLAPMSSY